MSLSTCPICGRPNQQLSGNANTYCFGRDVVGVNCRHCGEFLLLGSAASHAITWGIAQDPRHQARFSYALRRLQQGRSGNAPLEIDEEAIDRLWHEAELPTPREQADNLILHLGGLAKDDPGAYDQLTYDLDGAVIGCANDRAYHFIVQGLEKQSLIEVFHGDHNDIRLTFAGWDRYEELVRGLAFGNTAFMAMKFGDPILDCIVEKHFKPAVAGTGFRLKRLNENQPAGLIDDHLRVEIKRARFLIADLTHANNGAYWEAGYAEGLGKTVIYTCAQDVFDDKSQGTHFDTNHHLTIKWDPEKPDEAARNLIATIRAKHGKKIDAGPWGRGSRSQDGAT